ncbi:hypothetical protein F8388_013851 [Cannabis sativa]|nr:hypothetical protein F8388_013851 [Cannabis sativa]
MDVSIDTDHSYGAAVIRDCNNRIQAIYSTQLNVTNPTLAEALMLVCATEFVVKCKLRKVLFFCDNVTVVNHFNDYAGEADHQLLNGVAERFKRIVLSLEGGRVQKINWGHNFMAHNSAKWARHHAAVGELAVNSIDGEVLLDDTKWFPDPG